MKKIIIFTTIILAFISCSKEENKQEDIRDKYVGTWNTKTFSTITFYGNDKVIGTKEFNETDVIEISKIGKDILLIDDMEYIVNGNHIRAKSEKVTRTKGDLTFVIVPKSYATLNNENGIVIRNSGKGVVYNGDAEEHITISIKGDTYLTR
ncbi:MAG: hypothetical protein KGV44_00575 [Flavobacteriaceae bacterium]|nr:hypothetical protein [Flavobacteriaceae bacterium]